MSDTPYLPRPSERPNGDGGRSSDPSTWLPSWLPPHPDDEPAQPDTPPNPAGQTPQQPAAEDIAPGVRTLTAPVANFHSQVDVAIGVVDQLIIETRKRDVLEGEEVDREVLQKQPFVRDAWTQAWQETLDPDTRLLREPVLVVVAPRAIGTTTFALRLLSEHTEPSAALVKLQADWKTPSCARLPLERGRVFQLDLKDPETDRVSVDFLGSLEKHAANLARCGSRLVLTVAQEVWDVVGLLSRPGVQVLRLADPPAAGALVEAHLRAGGHHEAAQEVTESAPAMAQLHGLNAVSAVRAAHRIVAAWEEHHLHHQGPAMLRSAAGPATTKTFEDRVLDALSDWRGELDELFGEHVAVRGRTEQSLVLEDRYLLLTLAVQQSAPVSRVSAGARQLQTAVESAGTEAAAGSAAQPSFAGRGLRRRIQDVGATVDARDMVLFDRPAYGRAVVEYVWDNYEAMRTPLIGWLAKLADRPDPTDPVVRTIAELALRHGTREHLGKLAEVIAPDLLGAVLRAVVYDEHVGRLVWATLYQWADTNGNAPTVVSTCRRVLADSEAGPAAAKMAVVRLRRVARTTNDPAVRESVLAAFEELAQGPGRTRLVTEVRTWQQGKLSSRSGGLAFLALMAVETQGLPWLLSADGSEIDVQRALLELLGSPQTAVDTIPRITDWIRSCAGDPDSYVQLRDQLLVPLRGHRMFQAGMDLMQALKGTVTAQGVNIAEDFYQHLVSAPLHKVFALDGTAR
ncbi:hypothetical protein SAMN05216371_8280 [Streptomyces sp. TLI_053]|uniref:hypothetical protein n=1 Tax=Streptomyces sp. TLI_053 TaxID=1855352 RepID=UPI00087A2DC5|nr:hypothetical protein [Streptomyces sp. TLI_053]SDT83449.1 hypothetical protein SAMN05216371_8280 [Streptomyces sp. TLI_053]